MYPEGLLWRPDASGGAPSEWWALYTLPRREKDLMRKLRAMEIPHYGPLVQRDHRSPAGRARRSWVPLFSSYVFLCGDDESRRRALTTNCICQCLHAPDAAALKADLLRIHRLVESGLPLVAESYLQPGSPVRIQNGPLRGLEGVLIRRHGQTRLLVKIDVLQQGASVLVDAQDIEPVG
jgi:transcriptional antiterminator RfaH